MNDDHPGEKFIGFVPPVSNFCKLPIALIEAFPIFSSLAELMVVLYVLRHTWGYQEFDEGKRITLDEFMNGRKRRNGTRIDNGTGLTKSAVLSGLSKAINDGFITVEIDAFDKARVQKFYQLNMQEGYESPTSDVGESDASGATSIPRTQKETNRKKTKKEPVTPQLPDVTPVENIHTLYEHVLGMTINSPREAELLADIESTYPLEWIKDAMEESIKNNVRKIAYFEAILKQWAEHGYKSNSTRRNTSDFEWRDDGTLSY